MELPNGIRNFNKRFLNRLTGKIARSSWGPFSIIYHVGRHSGKPYETPIIDIPTPTGFVVALTYGPNVDWFRNISSAGNCRILRHRHETIITTIETLETQAAIPYFPLSERIVLKIVGTQHFVKMTAQPA